MFLDKCLMSVLNVKPRDTDTRLLCESENHCPDWYWCTNGTRRVVFHPFKTVDAYKNCMANAVAGAQPMPPPPLPCSPPGNQCGGFKNNVKWTGPNCCVQGSSCVQKNPWYFQCQADCAGPGAQCGGD